MTKHHKLAADELRNITSQHGLWLALTTDTARYSAATWQSIAQEIAGRKGNSGKDARTIILNHLSDNMLLSARVEQVKNSFNK